MANLRQQRLQTLATRIVEKSAGPSRRKCFVSYGVADMDEVENFILDFGHVFIPKVIGVTEEDEFIDSENTDYIMNKIREKYLTDSTVTMVLLGTCTWARKFVDWEIYSSLRNDPVNKRNGLMAITLPSISDYDDRKPPERVTDNLAGDNATEGYARWWKYPTSSESLRSLIETAFDYRMSRSDLVVNSRARKVRNSECP